MVNQPEIPHLFENDLRRFASPANARPSATRSPLTFPNIEPTKQRRSLPHSTPEAHRSRRPESRCKP
jgi:hypothetical protein